MVWGAGFRFRLEEIRNFQRVLAGLVGFFYAGMVPFGMHAPQNSTWRFMVLINQLYLYFLLTVLITILGHL